MFGNSKSIPFDPYRRRRSRRLMPRWLVLILLGVVFGAAGVVYVQERHLPPRLSADASAKLQQSFDLADAERTRLRTELSGALQRLDLVQADNKDLTTKLGERNQAVQDLRADAAALIEALPPDPRGGTVAVRAARFSVERGSLAYDVVLSRDRTGGAPFGGVLQFVVAGASEKGATDSMTSKPVPVSIDRYDSVRGTVPLPPGFTPRQTTIRVLDKVGGRLLGMRVINVK